MIKIIFFDIDGTLVQLGKNEMTQKVKNTLIRLQNALVISVSCVFGKLSIREVSLSAVPDQVWKTGQILRCLRLWQAVGFCESANIKIIGLELLILQS